MRVAPPILASRIKELVAGRLEAAEWGTYFLDKNGTILSFVDIDDHQRRQEVRETLLRQGTLAAVVIVGLTYYQRVFMISVVETFEDPRQPTIRALISGGLQSRWIPLPDTVIERWLYQWKEGEQPID